MQQTKPRIEPRCRDHNEKVEQGDRSRHDQARDIEASVKREPRARHRDDAAPRNPLDVLSRAFNEHAPSVPAPDVMQR